MEWNIITDSSCDITEKEWENPEIGFEIAPLKLIVGDRQFTDTAALNPAELLHAMQAEKRASSSACPSPEEFRAAFSKADRSLCFTMTSALSGTYNCACLAKNLAQETQPEKKIHVVDSKATAGSLVLLMRRAVELISCGLNFEEICSSIDEYNRSLRLVFTLANFDNLIKAGRMNPITGTIAARLGIRAVAVKTDSGEISVVKKVRGEEHTIKALIEIIRKEKGGRIFPVVISHCNNEKAALGIRRLLQTELHLTDVTILPCRGLTTYYAMDKGLIVAY